MRLAFTKMHGLGNDFVVIDAINQSPELNKDTILALTDRRMGIGCDQVLVVGKSPVEDCEFHYRIFNADGSEVEQCGNGARCFARFVLDQGLANSTTIPVLTSGGRIVLEAGKDNDVTVDMGAPRLAPADIPLKANSQALVYAEPYNSDTLEFSAVSMGNPHAVLIVDDVTNTDVETIGPYLQASDTFPEQANIGFMEIIDRGSIKLRVYERGAGETLACGTGACAAVVAGRLRGLLDQRVTVILPAGELTIDWPGEGHSVMMTGPATTVFHGYITL